VPGGRKAEILTGAVGETDEACVIDGVLVRALPFDLCEVRLIGERYLADLLG
jgi:hypothetical protein